MISFEAMVDGVKCDIYCDFFVWSDWGIKLNPQEVWATFAGSDKEVLITPLQQKEFAKRGTQIYLDSVDPLDRH